MNRDCDLRIIKKLSKSKLIWSLNSPTTAIYLFQRFIWRPSIVKYEEWIPNELLTWMNAFWLWSTPLSVFLAPYSRSSYHFKHVCIKTPEMNILHTLNTFNSSVSKRDMSWILTQGSCQERRNDPIFMSVIKELNCLLYQMTFSKWTSIWRKD